MDSILNINKPKGITSHDVVDIVRKKYGVKRVGHCGTLDPMAMGVLIVLVGKETERQSEFMGLEKEYVAEMVLGFETETGDLEGKVVDVIPPFAQAKPVTSGASPESEVKTDSGRDSNLARMTKMDSSFRWNDIQQVLKSFVGEIEQEVPIYSAVKIKGRPLYKYAREGKSEGMVLPKRKVLIKDIELLGIGEDFVSLSRQRNNSEKMGHTEGVGEGLKSVSTLGCGCSHFGGVPLQRRAGATQHHLRGAGLVKIRVVCAKGTYIRSLVRDIGRKLGCGATMVSLVRTRIGDFRIEKAVGLNEL